MSGVSERELLIAKEGVVYAASISSNTVNTATSPELLRDGAIAMYSKDTEGFTLLTGTSAASTARMVVLAQGTASGVPIISKEITKGRVSYYNGRAYIAPVTQVSYIGYDGTNGTGFTVTANTDYLLSSIASLGKNSSPYFEKYRASYYSLATGETQYNIVAKLIDSMNNRPAGLPVYPFIGEIIGNGTSTAVTSAASGTNKSIIVAATGTPTVTGSIINGTRLLTFTLSASTVSSVNFVVGDLVKIAGVIYRIAALGTTGASTYTVTLGRDYTGTTLSGAAASNFQFFNTADPTIFGLKLTAKKANDIYVFENGGGLEGINVYYTTAAFSGSGTSAELTQTELDAMLSSRAYFHLGTAWMEIPTTNVVSGMTYDIVTISHRNIINVGTGDTNTLAFPIHLQIAMPSTNRADTGITNGPSEVLFDATNGYVNGYMTTAPNSFTALTTV